MELTNIQKKEIFKKLKLSYSLIYDLELDEDGRLYNIGKGTKYKGRCYCNLNDGKEFENRKCRYCGNIGEIIINKKGKNIIKKEIEEEKKFSWWLESRVENKTLANCIYVMKNPDEEYGLLILKIEACIKANDNEIEEIIKIKNIIYVNSNKKSEAYKIIRGKEVEMDLFDAFNLNSKTMTDDVNIIWNDANGMLDFILKNKDIFSRYGILECFNNTTVNIPRNAFFMFYMYLYCKYPAIELLVKMNNIKLVSDIMMDLARGYNKENIRNRSKELDKLINKDATKGSVALRIPKYISDFLTLKDAKIDEFLSWCDFYELESFSKQQFEEIIEEDIFYILTNYVNFRRLLNALRYGYSYKKLSKYVIKQVEISESNYAMVLDELDDYRNMMNIMEIKADEYPSNLRSAHNNAVRAYKAAENALNDKTLKEIAKKVKEIKMEHEEYEIVIPETVADFIEEGNNQHNCVSSYVKKVIEKRCIIFFIRKKEDPEESFVTAEFCNDMLYQIMYKNNVRVYHKDVLDFAESFCGKLKSKHLLH